MSTILVAGIRHSHVNKKLDKIGDLESRSGVAQELSAHNTLSAIITRCSSVCDVVDLVVVVGHGQWGAIESLAWSSRRLPDSDLRVGVMGAGSGEVS